MEPVVFSYDPSEIGEIILKQLYKVKISLEHLCGQINISLERMNWIIYGPTTSHPSTEEFESIVPILFEDYNCSKLIACWSSIKLQKN
jgi:hypothetical protein